MTAPIRFPFAPPPGDAGRMDRVGRARIIQELDKTK